MCEVLCVYRLTFFFFLCVWAITKNIGIETNVALGSLNLIVLVGCLSIGRLQQSGINMRNCVNEMKPECHSSVCSMAVIRRENCEVCQNASALKKTKKNTMTMTLVVVEMISFIVIVWFEISKSHLVWLELYKFPFTLGQE